jgi:hypothetical protein
MKYVVYVSIGKLPRLKAEAHIEKVKESFVGFFDKNDRVVYLPTEYETRIEVLPENV